MSFAGAHPTDVRMTTRFKEHDLTEGLTGAIHETGHSLYEQVCRVAFSVDCTAAAPRMLHVSCPCLPAHLQEVLC